MINLLFVSSNTIYGKLIRWVTKSDWSHVEYLTEDTGISAVLGAGVRECPIELVLKDYNSKEVLKTCVGTINADPKQMEIFLRSKLGHKYDLKGIVFAFFGLPLYTKNKWFCSELIMAGLEQQGINVPCSFRGYSSPADIMHMCDTITMED